MPMTQDPEDLLRKTRLAVAPSEGSRTPRSDIVRAAIQGPFAWPPRFFERHPISKSWENEPWNQCQKGDFDSPEDEISFFLRTDNDSARYEGLVRPVLDICSGSALEDLLNGDSPGPLRKSSWLTDGRYMDGVWTSRDCLGALSARQLASQLLKKRYAVDNGTDLDELDEGSEVVVDAERRLIYITDLDRWSVFALVRTAPESQARLLGDFLQKHLCARSSIGVSFASDGPQTFALDFHIPFRVWRTSDNLMLDDRIKNTNKEPLRASHDISYLMPPSSDSQDPKKHGIYSGHLGFITIGYDQHRWTTHFAVDTWFDKCEDAQDKVMRYQYHLDEGMEMDPLSCGKDDARKPIWNPRSYFLRILGIRLEQVKDEWELIRQNLDNGLSDFSRKNKALLLRTRPSSTSPDLEEYGQRFEVFESSLGELNQLIQELSHDLHETHKIGEGFLSTEVNFFLNYDGQPGDASECYPSLSLIRRKFNEIGQLCIFFDRLKARCDDMINNCNSTRTHFFQGFGYQCNHTQLTQLLTDVVTSQAQVLSMQAQTLKIIQETASNMQQQTATTSTSGNGEEVRMQAWNGLILGPFTHVTSLFSADGVAFRKTPKAFLVALACAYTMMLAMVTVLRFWIRRKPQPLLPSVATQALESRQRPAASAEALLNDSLGSSSNGHRFPQLSNHDNYDNHVAPLRFLFRRKCQTPPEDIELAPRAPPVVAVRA